MKFKNILFFSLLICSPVLIYAQNPTESNTQNQKDSGSDFSRLSFKQRLTFNLGGGFMLGNTQSNINILPQLGYRVTERFTTGLGGNFQYYKNTFFSTEPFLIYGGNVFARYTITQNFFAQGEYQLLNFDRNWGEYGLIGGGYIPSRGLYISAYYLLLYPSGNNNIYGAPYVIRGGFIF